MKYLTNQQTLITVCISYELTIIYLILYCDVNWILTSQERVHFPAILNAMKKIAIFELLAPFLLKIMPYW